MVEEPIWNLVLHFINSIDTDQLPESSQDWLEQTEIHIENEFTEAFHCLNDLTQMNEA